MAHGLVKIDANQKGLASLQAVVGLVVGLAETSRDARVPGLLASVPEGLGVYRLPALRLQEIIGETQNLKAI